MSSISLLIATLALTLLPGSSSTPGPAAQSDADDLKKLRERLIKSEIERLRLSLKVARLERKPEDELAHLVRALKSEFPEVFGEALRELALMPEERRVVAVPAVLKRFGQDDDPYEIPAIEFLARVPSPEARATVLRSTRAKSPDIRRAAAAALTTATDDAALAALVALLEDREKDVRLTALEALGASKRKEAVPPLVALIGAERDAEIIKKAADALGSIGAPSAVDPLLDLLSKTDVKDVRWACIDSLGRIGESRAAPKLRPFVGPAQPMDIRQVTIQTLGKLKDADALPDLTRILRTDGTEFLRQEAAASIALMATPDAIQSVLLPAYLEEKAEAVGQTIWKAMLDLAGDSFVLNERLAASLLEKGRRTEAEQVCTARLHALKPDEAGRDRYLAFEEAIAKAAFTAGDARASLPHYRQLAAHAPERADVLQQVAACYRAIKDFDSCLSTLRELDARLAPREAAWWKNRMLIVGALKEAGTPEALIVETHALLLLNPPPHPEARVNALRKALTTGVLGLTAPLASRDGPERAAALAAVRKHGPKLIAVVADLLERAEGSRPALIHAGNAVTGTAYDPGLKAPDARKAAAAAWKAWLAARKGN